MNNTELAKRAVACKGWRGVRGMTTREGYIVIAQDNLGVWAMSEYGLCRADPATVILDLDDPATLGCLLQLVREAWNDPSAHVSGILWNDGELVPPKWTVVGVHHRLGPAVIGWHLTEAEALVAALEAAQ